MFEISFYEIAGRLLLAALLGGTIGWERERRNKQAGVKTHLLVSVGSALIMLLSIYGFADFVNHVNARYDPARLAAQVVSGIGFLGAGAILRHSNVLVSGLTTAATLWVCAAIGLSTGAGFYFPAVAAVVIALTSIVFLRGVEVKYAKTIRIRELTIAFDNKPGVLKKISQQLEREQIEVRKVTFSDKKGEDGKLYTVVKFRVRMPTRKDVVTVAERLQRQDAIKEVQFDRFK